jgi:hypothetical protein
MGRARRLLRGALARRAAAGPARVAAACASPHRRSGADRSQPKLGVIKQMVAWIDRIPRIGRPLKTG